MVVLVRLSPELAVGSAPRPHPRRPLLDVGGHRRTVRLTAASRTESVRGRIHEVLAFGPIVRIIQRFELTHPVLRSGSELLVRLCRRSCALWLLGVVDVPPRAVLRVAAPWRGSFSHQVSFTPATIVTRAITGVARSAAGDVRPARNRLPSPRFRGGSALPGSRSPGHEAAAPLGLVSVLTHVAQDRIARRALVAVGPDVP